MSTSSRHRGASPFRFQFYNVRNISSPEDLQNGRKVFVGYAPISSVRNLPTDENVREYLLEAEGKQRRRPTQVHKAIQETLNSQPDNFSVLNSGIVIVARDCEIDEKEKSLLLLKPSIINGSQTQGVLKDFLSIAENQERFKSLGEPHIKFELVVTEDQDLIAEISIARNFQNDVMTISIAGRRGQLNELEEYFQRKHPDFELQKSETKLSDDYVKTERLLQVITALIPIELWKGRDFNKVYTYSMKAKCLKDFQEVYVRAKDPTAEDHASYKDLYQFYLDVAADAYSLYEKWKSHPGFKGTGIRSIERDGPEIVEVPDGIIFPILASFSAFAKKRPRSGWVIDPPKIFKDKEIIQTAVSVYKEIANHNPWNMGKSRACYSALYQITSIYSRLSEN